MFERFTDGARRAVLLAQEEARARGASAITVDHLLLAILMLRGFDPVVPQALSCLDGSIDEVAAEVHDRAASGTGRQDGHLPFDASAKGAMEQALREAVDRGAGHIGCEHFLLAIAAQGDSVASQALVAHGATHDGIASSLGAANGPGFTVKTTKGSGRFRRGSKGGG